MTAAEVNFDGLVGPTHNYGGLSLGNVASMTSGGGASSPRAAVKQGLAKMRAMVELGLTQALLLPHERPYIPALRALGYSGSDRTIAAACAKSSPALWRNVCSASAMWTANAGTVSPSADTDDHRVHFTAANLSAMTHRSFEHPFTSYMLRTLFPDEQYFSHHPAIHSGGALGDEGAANYGRLCATHDMPGISLFVHGRSAFEKTEDWRFKPRQALEAFQAISRLHGVTNRSVFLRQSRTAIEAGAFHNDVVGVANGPVLFYHQDAYEDAETAFDAIRRHADTLGFEPIFIEVPRHEVPLDEAISSYLFNSQLITLPDGSMTLILPSEAEETDSTRTYLEKAVASNGPIASARFFDLKQSMKNGGGPACLRLRIVLTEDERKSVHQGVFMDHAKLDLLEQWADRHYRDRLTADDLSDPALLTESKAALDELTQLLDLGSLYEFQRI